MRILIAEDDSISGMLLKRIIAPFSDCDLAVNGKDALRIFKEAFENGRPYDLVFLDIMMPEMNGQEVLNCIRDYEQEKLVPIDSATKVIMTTALDDEENILEAHVGGCCAYLVKPINKTKVIKEIETLGLNLKR